MDVPHVNRGPTGIVAGLGRAGTTWLHQQLEADPAVFTPAQKEIWFFDRFYDRGLDWYLAHFNAAPFGTATVDVSHDYFFHPLAPGRIARDCPQTRVLVVLRDPVTWSLSVSRREAVTRHGPGVTARHVFNTNLGTSACALFSTYVRMWLDRLGDRVTFLLYEELRDDPVHFWGDVCRALGFEPRGEVSVDVVNDTKVPRVPGMYKTVSAVGARMRNNGLGHVVGRVKRNALVRRALLGESGFESRLLEAEELVELREFYWPEVQLLGELLSRDLAGRWGYE
jgi:hypothetical protein